MTSKRNTDINVNVNLNVNLNICKSLVTKVTYARTDVTSQRNTTRQAHEVNITSVNITSPQRQCNVMTLHRR